MNDTRGSIWRKWDLHFHTPSSYDYGNKSVTNQQIIDTLKKNSISLVVITDHHIIDIDRIKELQTLGGDELTVLPGIEFLSDSKGKQPVHFIGIFSESCNLKHVWGQLQNKTNISRILGEGKKPNEIYCNLQETIKLIKELGGVVSIHAGEKSNSIENITHSLPHGEAQKTDIAYAIDIYELGKEEDQLGYRNIVFPAIKKVIPMIICSDNHNINKYVLKQNCWIKADPTFEGLKQIIIEPEDRVYIGEKPASLYRAEQNPTKYINRLEINKVVSSSLDEIWFEDLPAITLNPDLVAIIGNKGNGKSALADIIGLVGNTKNHEGFSFLHKEKFRKKRPNRSESYEASLKWENGATDGPKLLSNDPDISHSEKVKYIPQNYLEKLCAETDENRFSEELKKVIFSHVDESEKLGKYTLDELMEYKSEEVNKGIHQLKIKLSETNSTIENLEEKSTPEYRSKIEYALRLKKEELEAHKKNKPPKIKEPKKDESVKEEHQKISKTLNEIKDVQKKLEGSITEKKETRKKLALKLARLQKFEQSLNNFREQFKILKEQYEAELAEYDIEFDKIIKLSIGKKTIEINISKTKLGIQSIDDDLNEKKEDSLAYKRSENENKIKELQSKLDEPTRKFQEYQDKQKVWEEKEKEIIGADNKQESIKFYQSIIKYLDKGLNSEIVTKKEERIEIVKSIYSEKVKIVQLYKDLYKPVTEFITEYGELMKDYKINLDVSIQLDNFHEKFFDYISRGARGSFIGTDEGYNVLNQITDGVNFNSEADTLKFLDDILNHLKSNKRIPGEEGERRILDQLKQGHEVKDFYNFLFSLDYLEPNYKLKLGEKNISELSPGERGALLLIFYLLLDKQDIPLIIDQPEENLDNQSVYRILVKFIKEAKKKRQIIIVTHNPNLAVVCDAEQIICVKIEKENKNKVTFESGSIENPELNAKIVEILEGTFPAFDNRTEKYKVSKSL